MTIEVAALAALAVLCGIAFVVFPVFNYPGLATLSFLAMFVFALIMRYFLAKLPIPDERVQQSLTTPPDVRTEQNPRIPSPNPALRATVTKERDVMHTNEGSFTRFLGVMVAVLAYGIAAAVIIYWWSVFWISSPPDFNLMVSGQKIPPESYAIILLTAWSLSQRAMANWRPQEGTLGAVFWWLDLITSLGVAGFLGLTFFKAIMSGTNLTFLLVLGAFVMQAIGDILLNGRHRYEGDAAADPAHTNVQGNQANFGNTVQVLRAPNGSLTYNVYCNGQGVRILPPLNPGDPPQVEVLAA